MTTCTAELELPSVEELNQCAAEQAVNEEATAAIEAGDEAPAPAEPGTVAQAERTAAPEAQANPVTEIAPTPPVPAPAKSPAEITPPESKAADRLNEIKRARREVAARKAEYFEAKEVAKEAKKDWESARNRLEKIIDGERPAPIIDAIEAAGKAKSEAAEQEKSKAAVTEKKAKRKAGKAEGSSDRAATASAQGEASQAPSPDAWRSVPIEQLGLPPKLTEKLQEAAVATIGQLEDLRASRAHGDGLRSIKGIGKSKADAIEDAVISWLSRNRDKAALAEAGAK